MTSVARTGQTVLIAASSMLFAAFTSAMVVRRGLSGDWTAPEFPAWVWATLVLGPLGSLLVQRGYVKAAMAVGLGLVVSQAALLANLRMAMVGEAFAAVLIGAHAFHALAAVAALGRFGTRAALFWHFAGVLWIYVLLLFGAWA